MKQIKIKYYKIFNNIIKYYLKSNQNQNQNQVKSNQIKSIKVQMKIKIKIKLIKSKYLTKENSGFVM